MNDLTVEYVSHSVETGPVLNEVSFGMKAGECVVLVGPSGCGKTTLLRLVAGLTPLQQGHITIYGRKPYPGSDCAMIFQTPRLLPWRRVGQNVELVLRNLPRKLRRERASHFIKLLGLSDAQCLWPQQLSGGMQQRLALARALATDAPLLLLDEPFANLDALAREEMQEALIAHTRDRATILATHSIDEALAVGDRIILLHRRPGRIAQIFTPGLTGYGIKRRRDPKFYDALQVLSEKLREIAENRP